MLSNKCGLAGNLADAAQAAAANMPAASQDDSKSQHVNGSGPPDSASIQGNCCFAYMHVNGVGSFMLPAIRHSAQQVWLSRPWPGHVSIACLTLYLAD